MPSVATPQNATNYSFSRSDEVVKGRSPGDWIAEIVREKDRWERFEVRGGPTANARKMEQVAIIDCNGEADDIFKRIESCAVACGYRHVRVSVYAKGAKRPGDMMVWPVPEPDDLDDEEMPVNDPRNVAAATAGLLRQSYAFNQVLMNQLTTLTSSHLLHLQAENKALREERGEMRAQVMESEKALGEREVRAFAMQQKHMRDKVIAEGATSLVQAAATHIAALPAAQSPLQKALERLTSSLSQEQLSTLMQTLGPEQQALFVSLLEKIDQSKKQDDGQEKQ